MVDSWFYHNGQPYPPPPNSLVQLKLLWITQSKQAQLKQMKGNKTQRPKGCALGKQPQKQEAFFLLLLFPCWGWNPRPRTSYCSDKCCTIQLLPTKKLTLQKIRKMKIYIKMELKDNMAEALQRKYGKQQPYEVDSLEKWNRVLKMTMTPLPRKQYEIHQVYDNSNQSKTSPCMGQDGCDLTTVTASHASKNTRNRTVHILPGNLQNGRITRGKQFLVL